MWVLGRVYIKVGRRVIAISGFLIWSKILMELIFNLSGEFRLAKSTLLTSTMMLWHLFRSFKACSDAKERVGCGKQRESTAPIQSLVKLLPWQMMMVIRHRSLASI